eukprot:4392988-Prymnesium_polylepis.1
MAVVLAELVSATYKKLHDSQDALTDTLLRTSTAPCGTPRDSALYLRELYTSTKDTQPRREARKAAVQRIDTDAFLDRARRLTL